MRRAGKTVFCAAVLCLAASAGASAQDYQHQLPGIHTDTLHVADTQPFQLSPFVISPTFQLFAGADRLADADYLLDARYGKLWLHRTLPDTVSYLVAQYRTLPFNFRDVYYRRRLADVDFPDTAAVVRVVEERPETPGAGFDLFGETTLQRSGSITRGIIMGSNRDVSIESGLRMQLSGEITPGMTVNAVLTDENTPIQPEGTTARLSDFDRVFIQLETRDGTATLGDFDMIFQDGEFSQFSRKLQGVSVRSELPGAPQYGVAGGTVTVAGATSRGVFQSQEIQPLEGVQGPYRLLGRGGEQFIIVIAGSERVYLDGNLLRRGESNDYVIDYATGEVTFTSRRLITSYSRITVDFEYTTHRFTRTLVGSQALTQLMPRNGGGPGRLRLGATFIREADSRSFNEELGLSSEDLDVLARAGDGPAVRPGAQRVPFDAEAPFVQYVRRDTLVAGERYEVFVPVSQPVDTVYRVRFTRVSPGEGDYRRGGREVNGILYEWVGPGHGDYVPLRMLPKPELQQMVDLTAAFEPLDGLEIFGEWARSVNDQNRLSILDGENNAGGAYIGGVRLRPTDIGWRDRDIGKLSFELRRRYTDPDFETFDRTRPIEFGRRWNLSRAVSPTGSATEGAGEGVNEARLRMDFSGASSMQGEFGQLRLGGGFEGTRRAVNVRTEEAGYPLVNYQIESIDSRDTLLAESGTWLRQLGSVRKPLWNGRIAPFIELEQERRALDVMGADSLTARSFSFVEWRPGVMWSSSQLSAAASVGRRMDQLPGEGTFRNASTAWTSRLNVDYRPSSNFSTEGEIGYRVRTFTEYFRINQAMEDNESVLVRLISRYAPLRRALEANWHYEALTERTPILQETYIKVGPEFGSYVWIDFNGDGIPQIDEFVPERTPYEGTYARTFVPSDDLIPVINVQTRLRLRMEPARLWQEPTQEWQRWLGQISGQTMIEVQEKSSEPDLKQIYFLNPGNLQREGTTMSGRIRVGQDIYLFRGRSRYGATISLNQLHGMSVLAAGSERRFMNNWRFDGNYRLTERYGVRLVATNEQNRVSSEAFGSRTFDITGYSLEPELAVNLSRAVRMTGGVSYSYRVDERPGAVDRSAQLSKIPLQATFMHARRLQLSSRAERADVILRGDATGLAAFELTEGRGAGTSYLFNITGQYTVSRYLRASMFYDGRIAEGAPQVHTVRMQLSAIF